MNQNENENYHIKNKFNEPIVHSARPKQKEKSKVNRKLLITLLIGVLFFIFLAFLSLGLLTVSTAGSYIDYKNNELVFSGENEGYIMNPRNSIDTYENIEKNEKSFNFSFEKEVLDVDKIEKNKEILDKFTYKDDIKDILIEHGKYAYVTSNGTEPLKITIPDEKVVNKEPIVCVQDWFDDGDYHGELVYNYIKSLYDGPVYLIDNNLTNFENAQFVSPYDLYEYCDVVNLSIGVYKLYPEFLLMTHFKDALSTGDTLIFYAAGNNLSNSSLEEQGITKFKQKVIDSNKSRFDSMKPYIETHLLGVTQGLVNTDENTAYLGLSGGEEIDYIVLNSNLYADGQISPGTSFASPFAVAMAANLLKAGVPKDQIHEYLKSDYELVDKHNVKYNVLLADDIQNKIDNMQ